MDHSGKVRGKLLPMPACRARRPDWRVDQPIRPAAGPYGVAHQQGVPGGAAPGSQHAPVGVTQRDTGPEYCVGISRGA